MNDFKIFRLFVSFATGAGLCFAQQPQQGVPAPSSGVRVDFGAGVRGPSTYSGSVSGSERTPGVLQLTLEDAINRGLRFNLALVEGGEEIRARRAEKLRALSAMLPTLNVRPSVSEQQINLAAFGFTGFPGIPAVVGPFSIYDLRGYGAESLSFQSWRYWKATREGIRASELSTRDAREQVVLLITTGYLRAAAGLARIEAQRGQVATAETEARQAQDRKNAGTVPGIDVLRAQVEAQQEQQRLISYEGDFDKLKLMLSRAIGLAPGQEFELADKLRTVSLPAEKTLEESIDQAMRGRFDLQSAEAALRSADLQKSAAQAGRLPSAGVDANYGVNGLSMTALHGSFSVAGSVNIPIFQGRRVEADVAAADAVVRQRRAEYENIRGNIDADVRAAYTDLRSASRQVEVATSGLALARQQLQQAEDRFAAGVTNNLEVVQAQQAVATANDNYISSVYLYYGARAELVRARGDAEQTIRSLLRSTN